MKKAAYFCIIGVIVLCCIFLTAAPIINNYAAKKTADTLVRIPLPESTEYIESRHKAGKLIGSGNGMQYFGAVLIKSGLSLEELKEYYSQFAQNEWECIVEKQEGADIKIIEHGTLVFEADVNGDGFYIVYSWGSNDTIFSELDIRGH